MLEPEATLVRELIDLSPCRAIFFLLLQSGICPFASKDHIQSKNVSPVNVRSGVKEDAYQGRLKVGPKYGTITKGRRVRLGETPLTPRA
jgi:hypothetical protein